MRIGKIRFGRRRTAQETVGLPDENGVVIWAEILTEIYCLARANIRKAKGQTAAIIVLVLLSSMMMNLWLMLSMDYRKNFDPLPRQAQRRSRKSCGVCCRGRFQGTLFRKCLTTAQTFKDYTVSDVFCAPFSFEYNSGELSQLGVILERRTRYYEVSEGLKLPRKAI